MSNSCCSRKLEVENQVNALREKVNKNPEKEDCLFNNPRFSDFQIKAGPKTFYVTKHQLALKSEVFQRMFNYDMKETNEGFLELQDDADAVKAMLRYIYMYKKVKGNKLARKVVHLAHRYEINELKDQCELEMIDRLTKEEARESWRVADTLDLSLLFVKCNEILYYDFKDIEDSELKENILDVSITPVDDYTAKGVSSYLIFNNSKFKISYNVYPCWWAANRVLEPAHGWKIGLQLDGLPSLLREKCGIYYRRYDPDAKVNYNGLVNEPSATFYSFKPKS
uniref:BTB domain-containing protein n=1 Tax=Bursaphelenchus xylophilus TaxID=6326 RepID=A0A1I7SJ52_BURXY